MTLDPTKDDRFPIVSEMRIVFNYILYEVQLELNPSASTLAMDCMLVWS